MGFRKSPEEKVALRHERNRKFALAQVARQAKAMKRATDPKPDRLMAVVDAVEAAADGMQAVSDNTSLVTGVKVTPKLGPKRARVGERAARSSERSERAGTRSDEYEARLALADELVEREGDELVYRVAEIEAERVNARHDTKADLTAEDVLAKWGVSR